MTILATPWLVSRLPEDYLLNRRIAKLARGPIPLLILTLRGVVGLVMVALGIVMMVTPGPGIVMLLLGVSVAEFPGKHRLLLYIGTRPRVFASLNWMRERHNKPPLRYPHAS